jgi:hypothetical protein
MVGMVRMISRTRASELRGDEIGGVERLTFFLVELASTC